MRRYVSIRFRRLDMDTGVVQFVNSIRRFNLTTPEALRIHTKINQYFRNNPSSDICYLEYSINRLDYIVTNISNGGYKVIGYWLIKTFSSDRLEEFFTSAEARYNARVNRTNRLNTINWSYRSITPNDFRSADTSSEEPQFPPTDTVPPTTDTVPPTNDTVSDFYNQLFESSFSGKVVKKRKTKVLNPETRTSISKELISIIKDEMKIDKLDKPILEMVFKSTSKFKNHRFKNNRPSRVQHSNTVESHEGNYTIELPSWLNDL